MKHSNELETWQFSLENLVKENQQLLEAVRQQAVELNQKERELEIEAALENVRARSMAMCKSIELPEVASIMAKQIAGLGISLNRVWITLFEIDGPYFELWITTIDSFDSYPTKLKLPAEYFQENMAYWKEGHQTLEKFFTPEQAKVYLQNLRKISNDAVLAPDEYLNSPIPFYQLQVRHRYGVIGITSATETDEQTVVILKRFASVFEQAYTRFLDMQKAEAQARESNIEAALERVRAHAMAMRKSDELADMVHLVFNQLDWLKLGPLQVLISIFDIPNNQIEWWSRSYKDINLPQRNIIPIIDHPFLNEMLNAWERGAEFMSYHLEGVTKRTWDEYLFTRTDLQYFPPELIEMMRGKNEIYLSTAFMNYGGLETAGNAPLSEENAGILKRFACVLDLGYTRMIDLQKAEAQARKAMNQASLDRVRAEIASMRTKKDLARITPLFWRELTNLNIPFVRCGVLIMNDELERVQTFLSTPEGNAIAAFHLDYQTGSLQDLISHWQQKRLYITYWTGKEFGDLADTLVKQGSLTSREQYLNTVPEEGTYLHFIPFLQGMLYVGNCLPLEQDDLHLVQSLADAFSTAYARYDDFNRLDAAKKEVEKTLSDLRQAQQQLVQAEKMASLGALTAGIAHEIQNPLNFVNNFSEVSKELIEELKSERLKVHSERDEVLETELLNDIAENLEKINHHGKRAEAIVKGMLAHSRTGSGKMELTDLNALAEEYLKLAYHAHLNETAGKGMRVKDSKKAVRLNYSASFKFIPDNNLPKVEVIPQEIGRVLLNLINNAFYAVAEKHKNGDAAYVPEVKVTTKLFFQQAVAQAERREGTRLARVAISVQDNGPGIPSSMLDKIFQPFFTTKPAGKGTGLGLSLSYDIVTAHGGELKVETTAGDGTEFIIVLPA